MRIASICAALLLVALVPTGCADGSIVGEWSGERYSTMGMTADVQMVGFDEPTPLFEETWRFDEDGTVEGVSVVNAEYDLDRGADVGWKYPGGSSEYQGEYSVSSDDGRSTLVFSGDDVGWPPDPASFYYEIEGDTLTIRDSADDTLAARLERP
jgi:hypothetical protein